MLGQSKMQVGELCSLSLGLAGAVLEVWEAKSTDAAAEAVLRISKGTVVSMPVVVAACVAAVAAPSRPT